MGLTKILQASEQLSLNSATRDARVPQQRLSTANIKGKKKQNIKLYNCHHNPVLEHILTPEIKCYFRVTPSFAIYTDTKRAVLSRPCSWNRGALRRDREVSPKSQISCNPNPRSVSGKRPSICICGTCIVKNPLGSYFQKVSIFFVTYITVDVLNWRGNLLFFNCQKNRAKEAGCLWDSEIPLIL